MSENDNPNPGSPDALVELLRAGTFGRIGEEKIDALSILMMMWALHNADWRREMFGDGVSF